MTAIALKDDNDVRRVARDAGADLANRRMRHEGRTAWNEDDWNAAADEYDRVARALAR